MPNVWIHHMMWLPLAEYLDPPLSWPHVSVLLMFQFCSLIHPVNAISWNKWKYNHIYNYIRIIYTYIVYVNQLQYPVADRICYFRSKINSSTNISCHLLQIHTYHSSGLPLTLKHGLFRNSYSKGSPYLSSNLISLTLSKSHFISPSEPLSPKSPGNPLASSLGISGSQGHLIHSLVQ